MGESILEKPETVELGDQSLLKVIEAMKEKHNQDILDLKTVIWNHQRIEEGGRGGDHIQFCEEAEADNHTPFHGWGHRWARGAYD